MSSFSHLHFYIPKFFYMIYFDFFILKKLLDKKQKSKDFEGLSKSKNRLYFIWKFLTSFLDQNCLYLINHFLIVFINIKFTTHSYGCLVLETTAAELWLETHTLFPLVESMLLGPNSTSFFPPCISTWVHLSHTVHRLVLPPSCFCGHCLYNHRNLLR